MKKFIAALTVALLLPIQVGAQPFAAQIEAARGRLKLFTTALLPSSCAPGLAVFDTTTQTIKVCQNDGTTFTAVGGGSLTPGTTVITGGTDTRVLFDDAGLLGEDAGLTYVKGTGTLTVTTIASGFNLGNADTTFTRAAAGAVNIEGDRIATAGAANSWTGTNSITAGAWFWSADTAIIFGASGDNRIQLRSANTPDTTELSAGSTSNSWLIAETADAGFDFNNCSAGTLAATDPTLCIHSHNQSTTEWMDFKHNGAQGIITTGLGPVALKGGAAVASATALPLPTGNIFHVTGTTNITSITATSFVAGTTITLIFDGVLTFTDGNNLVLAGNFVTTADDAITLAFDGTNFYEVARSIN